MTLRNALGDSRCYTFDDVGNIVHYVDERGESYTCQYGEQGCLIQVTQPDGSAFAYDGGYVVIRIQNTANDGQIVVAIEGDGTTLQRIF